MQHQLIHQRCSWWLLCICCCWLGCTNAHRKDPNVFYYNESSGIATLDPAFAKNQSIMWVLHQVYSTLVNINSKLEVVPAVAKRWEVDATGTRYKFYLRDDVYFIDNPCFPQGKGRKLIANDVVYSLQRIMLPATASSGAWIFNNRVVNDGFHAINDTTFELVLAKPFPPILGILSMQYCSIVPHEAVAYYGNDFRRNPVGTGPFQLKYWEEGQALVLAKNERYWEFDSAGIRLPYLNGVQVSFFDNKATEFLLFRQGRLSFINDIDPSFKDEVLTRNGTLRPQWQSQIRLHKAPYLNTEYFGIAMHHTSSVLQRRLLRKAINYAIDKRKLITYLRNGIGTAAEAGFAPLGLASRNAETIQGYTCQPATARALIAQAKYQPNTVITLTTIPQYADMASYAARQLEEVGLTVKVDVVQKSLLLEQTAKGQADFFRGSWIADYPDAENYMAMFYSKNPAPPNYTRYHNKAFDALYEQALLTTDTTKRYQYYRSMDSLIMQDAPVVPLFYDQVIHLVQPYVQNFAPTATNMLELRTVKLLQ